MKNRWLTFWLFLLLVFLGGGCARERGDTAEYREFLTYRSARPSVSRQQTAEGITYGLEDGVLTFTDSQGEDLWQSDSSWYVEDFYLWDVDGDGDLDCLFSLWKSYSFDARAEKEDDPRVRNHLFLYTLRGGHPKSLWCSSALPRPIYSFEMTSGTPTPVSTGTVLTTEEGMYTDDFSLTPWATYSYTWQGWGFVPDAE